MDIPMQYALRRRMMCGDSGTPLSALSQGSIVKIKESGVLKEFIVAKHGYPAAGRTLLLRKKLLDSMAWNTARNNNYAVTSIDSWLNSTYLSKFAASIKDKITAVTIKYTATAYYTSQSPKPAVSNLSRKCFLLSAIEVYEYCSSSGINVEGEYLGIFPNDSSRFAYLETSSTVQPWWLRSTSSSSYANYVTDSGDVTMGVLNELKGIRPAFTLPSTIKVADDGSIV